MTETITTREPEIAGRAKERDVVDFDLHGIVGIRLVGGSSSDIAVVKRQLRPLQTGLSRRPDLVIRFVDQLDVGAKTCLIGLDDAAFTDEAFLILPAAGKQSRERGRTQIPLDQIGGPCEIVCESGLSTIPLLLAIVNLTAIGKGFAPAHASAVSAGAAGIVTTGWTSGGKTGLLLTLMSLGCRFISDDVVYIGGDGRFYGLHQPINVKDYYLDALPQYRKILTLSERLRLRGFRLLESLGQVLPESISHRVCPARWRNRFSRILRSRRAVHLRPERLFGREFCAAAGQLEQVILAQSHTRPEVTVETADPYEVALRMAFSSQHELLDLSSYYLKYRFAFPHLRNERIEQAEQEQQQILRRALAGKKAHIVSHPYPASVPDLQAAIQRIL